VVHCLPSKHEILSLNPSTVKKKKKIPHLQNNQRKMDWRPVAECLLCKHEALSSNPGSTKTPKGKRAGAMVQVVKSFLARRP
jgi:hypothetical protein